jgi:hypothetical protein
MLVRPSAWSRNNPPGMPGRQQGHPAGSDVLDTSSLSSCHVLQSLHDRIITMAYKGLRRPWQGDVVTLAEPVL